MFTEDELLPLSALQHLLFCERQCALIHVEQAWSENRLTVEGRIMHERVDSRGGETRGIVRIAHGVPLQSLRLGLVGRADVVEFHGRSEKDVSMGMPFPVEYKRGRPKANRCDEVQLCAQAICLEEMLDVHIPRGALFYGKTRRRKEVAFDDELRGQTEQAARRLHELVTSCLTPPPELEAKCRSCSLRDVCLPDAGRKGASAQRYLASAMNAGDMD